MHFFFSEFSSNNIPLYIEGGYNINCFEIACRRSTNWQFLQQLMNFSPRITGNINCLHLSAVITKVKISIE